MRRIFPVWFSLCLLAILNHICLAALPQSGTHEFDDFSAQEQQVVVPVSAKSSLGRNRVSNRAIAPASVAIPRSNPQLKSHLLQQKPVTSSTPAPQVETEQIPEANNVPKADNDEEAVQSNDEVSSSTVPSTEPTRKPFLNGRIRPFQSNREFFERLRRRQEQEKQHGYTVVPPTAPSTTTEKQPTKPNARKNVNVGTKATIPADQSGTGSQKKSTSSRRYNGKANSFTSTTPLTLANEAEVEESSPVTQTTRNRVYQKNNRRIS